MKVITLRNLPPDLARTIRRRADESRTSVSKTILTLLEEHLGTVGRSGSRRVYHDLDALYGSWAKDEAEALSASLANQRAIDEDVWK